MRQTTYPDACDRGKYYQQALASLNTDVLMLQETNAKWDGCSTDAHELRLSLWRSAGSTAQPDQGNDGKGTSVNGGGIFPYVSEMSCGYSDTVAGSGGSIILSKYPLETIANVTFDSRVDSNEKDTRKNFWLNSSEGEKTGEVMSVDWVIPILKTSDSSTSFRTPEYEWWVHPVRYVPYTFADMSDHFAVSAIFKYDDSDSNSLISSNTVLTEDSTSAASGSIQVQNNAPLKTATSNGNLVNFSVVSKSSGGGTWTATVNNSSSAVQALGKDVTATEDFPIYTAHGDKLGVVRITVRGVNDPATFTGLSGQVTEDTMVNSAGMLTAAGTITVTDADTGENSTQAGTYQATYGSLVVSTSGGWIYSVSNNIQTIQNLVEGQSMSQSFTVRAKEGTTGTLKITINGSNIGQTINGTSGKDTLTGTSENDTIYGFEGEDTISAGAGHDTINGGLNGSVNYLGSGSDTVIRNTSGHDVIEDFMQGEDRIDISGLDPDPLVNGDQSFAGPIVMPNANCYNSLQPRQLGYLYIQASNLTLICGNMSGAVGTTKNTLLFVLRGKILPDSSTFKF